MCRAIAAKPTVIRTPTLRRRRRVQFSGDAPSAPSSDCHSDAQAQNTNFALNHNEDDDTTSFLSTEEIQNRWYSKIDERLFKQNAVRELTFYRYMVHQNNNDMTLYPRGLERHTRQRRHYKKQTIRMIVLASKKGYSPDQIARLAQSKSNWNTQLATTQASIDQIDVLIEGNRDAHVQQEHVQHVPQQQIY
jgi:hypothetical protein